jgi:hypothetical protein
MKEGFASKEVSLSGLKDGKNGAKQVFNLNRYELWAFTHAVIEQAGKSLISSIQVGVKNIKTGDFFHSYSNNRGMNAEKPLNAEIRLIDYYPDSFLDRGEIVFGCDTSGDS